jgi:uncharacterized protein YbjT (DUF2867 family)
MKIILTGSTGMVGEGVLTECLQHPDVTSVLIINRRPVNRAHLKLNEVIHKDFHDLSAIKDQLSGYDACFFCLGVSSIGKKEPEYTHLTYDLTMNFAKTLSQLNKNMVFCYVSGAGTDSSEKGKLMWARVKGKTENDLMKLPFKDVYAFRPGFLIPSPGAQNVLPAYKYFAWTIPVLKLLAPGFIGSLKELGLAMINVTKTPYTDKVLDVKRIREISLK